MIKATVGRRSGKGASLHITRALQVMALVVGYALSGTACAGSEEEPLADYSEPCDSMTMCVAGLECLPAVGLCTQTCTSDASCRTNLSPRSICQSGACFEPCTAGSGCANGLRCTMAGTFV